MIYDKDVTTDYFNKEAAAYDDVSYAPGQPNGYRLELVLDILSRLPKGRILDAGCGSGQLLRHLVPHGWDCAGSDLSPGMVEQTRGTLSKLTDTPVPVVVAPLDQQEAFADHHFDIITSLGVIPYIPEENEATVYAEFRRLGRPGGTMIAAYENALFDLFTFNRYTMDFFEREFLPLVNTSDRTALRHQLETLVVHPNAPAAPDQSAARNQVFRRAENPLTLPAKLKRFGFDVTDVCYYHFHALPPFLRNPSDEMMRLSREMEIRHARSWQAMFMASTFIVVTTIR